MFTNAFLKSTSGPRRPALSVFQAEKRVRTACKASAAHPSGERAAADSAATSSRPENHPLPSGYVKVSAGGVEGGLMEKAEASPVTVCVFMTLFSWKMQ